MNILEIYDTMEYGPALESQDPAMRWLEEKKRKLDLFIDGQWKIPLSKKYFESRNPANRAFLAEIAEAGQSDVDLAVSSAKKAQPLWWELGPHGRARYLYALARQIQKHARLFSVLETLDNGKTVRETRDIDIPVVVRHFYHHAGWAQLMDSELRDYQPVGVVGQIIPWNFPLLMLSWKIAPALAMGNTVVLKPAEYTSITAIAFAEICQKINLPPGVVNIVTGDGKTGEYLVKNKDIQKIAFTGSTEVGRIIRKETAGSGKRITLELGGKSPFIVFEDADLDSVVEGVVDAIWFNQGQVCCAGSRLLVQENIEDRLIGKIKKRMEKLRVGNSLDKTMDLGAIVNSAQLESIKNLVQTGIDEGGDLWQPEWSCPQDGYYYPPSLFTNLTPSSTLAQEEIFGPVLISMSFRTPQEAVKIANNSRYGLAASIWTENINLALDIAPKIKAGTVWINSTNVFDAASGFGGCRESGFGREGGREGLWEYVKPKWEAEFKDTPGILKATKKRKTGQKPELPVIDRTPKLYIGGKQTRPESGYSLPVYSADLELIGEVGEGGRKDIRNAVEAARSADSWGAATGHNRAQVLYFLAENLMVRAEEMAVTLSSMTGVSEEMATAEVELSIRRIFTYAAFADKFEGCVHPTHSRNVTLAMPEPIGVMGVISPDEAPLLGFISTVIPPISMGNRVVAVPSRKHPLAATDFYQILDTSDVPGGVLNIITGDKESLSNVLVKHNDVDALWYFGSEEGSRRVEYESVGNLKRTWVNYGKYRDWTNPRHAEGDYFLRQATQIKNIWIPYGE